MENMEMTPMSAAQSMEGGFADPVFDAQFVFEKVMNAMARPGSIIDMNEVAAAPAPLFHTTSAILATLCDSDVSVWTDLLFVSAQPIADWLSFHTGSRLGAEEQDAQFAVICSAATMPPLANFAQGVQEYPDRSATLIIQVEALTPGGDFKLTGPGIETSTNIGIKGLRDDFLSQWEANCAEFPLGVDIILTSHEALVCLPRTTKISRQIVEEWR